jgi:hypothetical protein
MPRSRPPQGGSGYRRGTGLRVGRAARRRRTPWRAFIVWPLVGVVVLGAGALALAIVVNLVSAPPPRAALGRSGGSHATHPPARTTSASGGTAGGASAHAHGGKAPGGAAASGGRGATPGATSRGRSASTGRGGRSGSATSTKSAKSTKSGRTGPATASAGTGGAGTGGANAQGHGALTLVGSAAGVHRYAVSRGPIVASVHVAWPSWVRVVADGKPVFVHLETTGYSATFRGKRSLDVYLGYPAGSVVTVNGTKIGPLPMKSTLWMDVTAGHAG